MTRTAAGLLSTIFCPELSHRAADYMGCEEAVRAAAILCETISEPRGLHVLADWIGYVEFTRTAAGL